MKKILIAGKSIYSNKSFLQILLTFFGLNWSSLIFASSLAGLNYQVKLLLISPTYIGFLNSIFRLNYVILKILYKKYIFIIRAEKRLGSYRGLRLKLGLPNRGQRTHGNAKTSKKFIFK